MLIGTLVDSWHTFNLFLNVIHITGTICRFIHFYFND